MNAPEPNVQKVVYVGLGSNLKSPSTQIQSALAALSNNTHIENLEVAPLLQSSPLGDVPQPDYLNTVCRFSTNLSPLALLDVVQEIESAQGRDRQTHWGPRTIDLDILLYGSLVYSDERLTIPHPQMQLRHFVLQPLLQLDHTLTDPRSNTPFQNTLLKLTG